MGKKGGQGDHTRERATIALQTTYLRGHDPAEMTFDQVVKRMGDDRLRWLGRVLYRCIFHPRDERSHARRRQVMIVYANQRMRKLKPASEEVFYDDVVKSLHHNAGRSPERWGDYADITTADVRNMMTVCLRDGTAKMLDIIEDVEESPEITEQLEARIKEHRIEKKKRADRKK